MKCINGRQILNLAFCFYLFLGMARATQVLAVEYYTYEDSNGKLVISNKKPPPGSKIIKSQDLPELVDTDNGKASKAPAVGNNENGTDILKQ